MSKVFCIGRNYLEHAKELNNAVPTKPVVFMKPHTALLKENKSFFLPSFSNNIHHELEVVLKIGKNGKAIEQEFAHRYISEITAGIDFTARDIQDECKAKGLPWEIAKAFDNSAVIGNFIDVSRFSDLQNLNFHLLLNGHQQQIGNTSNVIFNFNFIIHYLSQFFTLQQGDLIYTGTPSGVGAVKIGDRLEGFLENEKLFDFKIE
jgi:2-keto-4-pentenoate hydratase/2-oxohepta-3-ene-1,7-dioic acid hydratase in catechol pathway